MTSTDHGNVDCVDTGQGPTVLFLPGSYSTTAAWRSVQKRLGPGWRTVTTSLCGYGGTAETRSRGDFAITHEVAVVEAVARQIGGPVHLVGHSFGATVALAAALGGTLPVASLALFEANPMPLLRGGPHAALYQEALHMSEGFEAAVDAGEADAAGRVIDFWGGAGTFASMPPAVQAYCRETAATNVLDWHTDFSDPITVAACRALAVPVLLVRGGLANPAMVALTDTLAQSVRVVQPAVVEGAGHFLITSHPQHCADLLDGFLRDVA